MTEVIVSTLCFSELKQRILNDKLMQLEKGFTFPNGIPGLPQIRLVDHSIGAVCSSNTSISFQRIKTLIAHLTEVAKATLKTIFFEEYGQKQHQFYSWFLLECYSFRRFFTQATPGWNWQKNQTKARGDIQLLCPVLSCSHWFNFGSSLHPPERSKVKLNPLSPHHHHLHPNTSKNSKICYFMVL